MKDSGQGKDVPRRYLWSAEEVAKELADHYNDPDWIPQELTAGGYVVKTLEGRLVPAPIKKET